MKLPAIIVDIDNTLAVIPNYHTEFFQPDKALMYKPNPGVLQIIEAYDECVLLLVTCRSVKHKQMTEEWCNLHGIKYDLLIMRADTDRRPDAEIKRDLVTPLMPKYDIKFGLDDKASIRLMYNDLGIATPDFPRI